MVAPTMNILLTTATIVHNLLTVGATVKTVNVFVRCDSSRNSFSFCDTFQCQLLP